jgi:hypothetical protein
MPSAAGADDGEDDIVADLMATYPTPLNQLLVKLYGYNRQAWLSGPMAHTLEAAWVRDTGLTPEQTDWAMGVAEMMDGDHPAFVALHDQEGEPERDADAEEIVSDTSVDDYLGGDLR